VIDNEGDVDSLAAQVDAIWSVMNELVAEGHTD
jgi:hypothetical protein